MQKAFLNSIYELAKTDRNVILLTADNGTDFDILYSRELPCQYYNLGIAESNMVGVSAGLASCGKIPFVFTGSSFLAYRSYEFIRVDACVQKYNVKFVGFGSGMSISMLGPTHHATEDISALRSLPNLTVLSPATPNEVALAVRAAYEIDGPVYVRLGMNGEKEVYDENYTFKIGKNVVIRDGTDIAIFSTGSILEEVLKVSELLMEKGISTKVINVPTIKPFDEKSVASVARKVNAIFSVEEHNIFGGIGSIVAEIIAENGYTVRFKRIGLNDCFATGYGNQAELRQMNGLDATSLEKQICEFLGRER